MKGEQGGTRGNIGELGGTRGNKGNKGGQGVTRSRSWKTEVENFSLNPFVLRYQRQVRERA